MGNKSRPGNEFVEHLTDRRRANTVPYTPLRQGPHPELRILQDASPNLRDDEYALDWQQYMIDVAGRHVGKLIGRNLGSVRVTIVSAQEVSKMMEKKFGDRFHRPDQAKKLLRGLATRTREFLYENYTEAADSKAHDLYKQLQTVDCVEDAVGRFAFSPELESDDAYEPVEDDSLLTQPHLTLQDKLTIEIELRYHMFGRSVYKVPQADIFQPYGRDAVGLDLSSNPEPFEYRDSLRTYFRKEEGFDIGLMDSNHRPHAVMFNLLGHLSTASFMPEPKDLLPPPYMVFQPIRLDASGNDDILFE